VRGFKLVEQTKGFGLITLVHQPVQRKITCKICSITRFNYLFSILVVYWIPVTTLFAIECVVLIVVKTCGFTPEVPFPNHGSCITGLFQKFWESYLASVKRIASFILIKTILVTILS